jgi:DNA (cytosine-5)-methyltransferase 1
MKAGSLFAGVGGFDLAAERSGMTLAWHAESDPFASKVLAYHWPDTSNYGDVHTLTLNPDNIGAGNVAPTVDVLIGGFPCQDYSMAGQRGGLAGDRGALWWQFHRLIDEGRPRWVVGENVPGILSSRDGQDFATIVDSLTDLGYRVAWRVLDAQYFGVAQRRRRVFIVGSLGTGSPSKVLALAEGLSGYPRPSRSTGQETAEGATPGTRGGGLTADDGAVRALTSRIGGTGPDLTDAEGGHIIAIQETVGPLTAGMGKGPRGTEAVDSDHLIPTVIREREGKPGGGKGILTSEDQSLTISAAKNDQVLFFNARQDPDSDEIAHPVDTGCRSSHAVAYAENQRGEVREVRDLNGVSGTSSASPASKNEAFVAQAYDEPSNMRVRRLTPLEVERLQGFPDGWCDVEGVSNTQRYRQMGNAVAVPVAEWIMRRIVAADKGGW